MMQRIFCLPVQNFVCALCMLLLLTACAAREAVDTGLRAQPRLSFMRDIADIHNLPQDLTIYAKQAGNEPLLTAEEQQRQNARFDRIFFGPWQAQKARVPLKELERRFGKGAYGFTENAQAWTSKEWEALRASAKLDAYPGMAQPGITLRNTNMRALPTLHANMERPENTGPENSFDNFQYSALSWATPLFITHATADGLWHFVESPLASGWVPADDIAPVDENFMQSWRNSRLAAIIRDEVPLSPKDGASGYANIGALFPLFEAKDAAKGDSLALAVPVRGTRGFARTAKVLVSKHQAQPKPLPLTPARIARVGNQMMAQPYGWGGLYERRDCSSSLRDLFTPFGIWLPRNSSAQSRSGNYVSLENLDIAEKERRIRAGAKAFASLIWMPGHITLYLGEYKGQSVIFHNIWGLRLFDEGNPHARHVLGRAVVTTLHPGQELPELETGKTLIERIGGFVLLPPGA